ncbi:MAG: coenzyme F420 biosynthesis-associated protein [Actinomycetota bacterium]|nr:MAG: coenzyme F420 biosynthesis-associated protein [Actinomycetota bacterium]
MADVVDWDLAAATGLRLVPGGPPATPAAARQAVDQLRQVAAAAVGPVREVTGLIARTDAATVVVDRQAWLLSNVEGFRTVVTPYLERVRARQQASGAPAAGAIAAVGSRATGAQVGAVLAWLSGKVLGQFEAFAAPGRPHRLLLVAPNIVQVERKLEVDPRDFRLWVALHEETHRVQFGAVPWLGDHLRAEIDQYLLAADLTAGDAVRRALALLRALVGVLRGDTDASVVEAAQTPAQRAVFDRLTALMSLLEGHADHVMDEVGPSVVPTVAQIRERFDRRRREPGAVDGLARRLLGLDAKLRQYSEGAAFVRGVLARAGEAGFARVWTTPEHLPTRGEIADPAAWVARVVGGAG